MRARQLPGPARRREAAAQPVRERAAEDEPARLGAEHEIRPPRLRPLGEPLDRLVQRRRVCEQRHDVLEDDPRLGEVRDVADLALPGPWRRLAHAAAALRSARQKRSWDRSLGVLGERGQLVEARFRRSAFLARRPGAATCSSSAASRSAARAERAQVPRRQPEARQLGAGRGDIGVALRVALAAPPPSSSPKLLELAHELGRHARRGGRARPASISSSPSPSAAGRRRWRSARRRRQLLADDAQRQELVALQPQDRLAAARRPPPRTAGSRPGCAAASAGPGPRGSGSSRSRRPGTRRWSARQTAPIVSSLAAGVLGVVAHRAKNVSRYLPICTSSPSSSAAVSMRARFTKVPLRLP